MTGIALALSRFWSQFGVPAYFIDLVPDDAVLPYITFDVAKAGFGGQIPMTAFNWHRDTLGGNQERTELMDSIAAAIPVRGVMLPVDGGYIILYRNESGFQQYWQDDTDGDVIGGRTSYIIHNHTMT